MPGACGLHIFGDLAAQLLKTLEALFLAQEMAQFDLHPLAVEVAVPIQDMDLEGGLRVTAFNAGPQSKVGHCLTSLARAVQQGHINAPRRQDFVLEGNVGRGKAELAPQLSAMNNFAAPQNRPPQKL